MNKKGFFFFFQWGKDIKQEQIFGVKLNFKCECKGDKFNLIYNLERSHIFWFIPVSGWSIRDIYLQCVKCGRIYKLDSEHEDKARDFYAEVKARHELETEGKIKPKKINLTLDVEDFSQEEKPNSMELKKFKEEDNKDFIRFLKWLGILVGIIILLSLIWKFIIT